VAAAARPLAPRRIEPEAPFLGAEPPHWAARGLATALMVLVAGGLVAAVLVRVPETVSAPFVLVPVGGSDPVRSPRSGSVTAVHAAEGSVVRAGETLFVVRASAVGAERAELESQEMRAEGAEARRGLEEERYRNQAAADAEEERRLVARLAHLRDKRGRTAARDRIQDERYQAQLRSLEVEAAAVQREIEFKTRHLAVAREMADRYRRGFEQKFLSWVEYIRPQVEAERVGVDLSQLERQLEAATLKATQLRATRENEHLEWTLSMEELAAETRETETALDKVRHESASRRATHRQTDQQLGEERDRAAARTVALRRDLAGTREDRQSVTAPCAATVLRLGARAPGAVVQEGEVLAELACAGTALQAEVTLPPAGAGRVRPGLGVKLLYDAFPYQRHGVRRGTVRWVSPAGIGQGAAALFRAHVELVDTAIRVDGASRPLRPGMTGRAEVVVGRRPAITYAFEPLRQLRESLADAAPR
jgi:hemolysin D